MTSQPNPRVSVCVAAYNTEAYVGAAVASVLDQTLTDVEVVILDNASADDTASVIAGFDDPRVRALQVDRNLGAAGGRAHTIDHARGEWVAVLDSDDWMERDRLERLVALGADTSADIVADDVHLIDDGADEPWGTLFTVGYHGLEGVRRIDAVDFVDSDRWLQPGLRLGLSKPMFKRSFLDAHTELRPDPGLRVVHDYWWVLAALIAGADFYVTPEPGYFYRAREGQLVTSGHELDTLDQQVAMATRTLARPEVQADPALVAALTESQQAWADARSYIQLRQALGSGRLRTATRIGASHPSAVKGLFTSLPGWLRRKLTGDRFAGHMTRRL